jgi:hypothetical protein
MFSFNYEPLKNVMLLMGKQMQEQAEKIEQLRYAVFFEKEESEKSVSSVDKQEQTEILVEEKKL